MIHGTKQQAGYCGRLLDFAGRKIRTSEFNYHTNRKGAYEVGRIKRIILYVGIPRTGLTLAGELLYGYRKEYKINNRAMLNVCVSATFPAL